MNKLQSIVNKWLCENLGHNWRYKNYSQHIKANGDHYDYLASRKCLRCREYGYYITSWEPGLKSDLDNELNYYATKSIVLDNIIYN